MHDYLLEPTNDKLELAAKEAREHNVTHEEWLEMCQRAWDLAVGDSWND
jgi:hypothetical protein